MTPVATSVPMTRTVPQREGRREFLARPELTVLAIANVRIGKDQFRNDLDDMVGQTL